MPPPKRCRSECWRISTVGPYDQSMSGRLPRIQVVVGARRADQTSMVSSLAGNRRTALILQTLVRSQSCSFRRSSSQLQRTS